MFQQEDEDMVATCCKRGKKNLNSVKRLKVSDKLKNYQLLKKRLLSCLPLQGLTDNYT